MKPPLPTADLEAMKAVQENPPAISSPHSPFPKLTLSIHLSVLHESLKHGSTLLGFGACQTRRDC